MILAVCPELHELIHHDADDEHHDCAVTAILSGGIEHTPIVPVVADVPAPALGCFLVAFDAQPAKSFFELSHSGTRASGERLITITVLAWTTDSALLFPSY